MRVRHRRRHLHVGLGFGQRLVDAAGVLVFPKGTPVTNLFLNMLDKLGVPADSIGDSTGRLGNLSEL